jgi:hypothetical protein
VQPGSRGPAGLGAGPGRRHVVLTVGAASGSTTEEHFGEEQHGDKDSYIEIFLAVQIEIRSG